MRLIKKSHHDRTGKGTNVLGLTLIELIMTIVVVSILGIPLALLLREHIEGAFQSQDDTMAVNFARLEMETVKNMSYDNILIGNFISSNPIYSQYGFEAEIRVRYIQGSGSTPERLKEIRVNVRKLGDPTVLFSLVTYLARNVNYGV